MRYQITVPIMTDPVFVDTEKASLLFEDESYYDAGRNVSKETRDPNFRTRLLFSDKWGWYIATESYNSNDVGTARSVSIREAALWLLRNCYNPTTDPQKYTKAILPENVVAVMNDLLG